MWLIDDTLVCKGPKEREVIRKGVAVHSGSLVEFHTQRAHCTDEAKRPYG